MIQNLCSKAVLRTAIVFPLLLMATTLMATHFRFGLMTATRLSETSTTVTYRLNVSTSWRLGAPSSGTYSISGGNSGSVNIPMTFVTDPSGQWTNGSGSATVTLNKTATPTRIEWITCCKISNLVNNRDQNWDVYTVINTANPGSSPVSTLPAIINMPVNASAATYTIPVSDPDPGSTLVFGVPNFSSGGLAGQSNPSGFSINSSTGQITLNTIGKSVGQLYNAMTTVTDNHGNQIMLDYIIQMVAPSTPPQFDYSVTPANNAIYNVIAGQNITLPIKATDSDAGSTVTLSASGLPAYITTSNFSPSLPTTGNPVQSTFSWTPTAAQIGHTVILNFIATDNVGVQTTTSVTIKVVAEPAPVFIAPTPPENSVRQILTGVPFQDIIRAQSSLGSNVSIAFANSIPAGATLSPAVPTPGANPGQTTLNWTPTPSNFGIHNLSFQATISSTPTIFSTRAYRLIVNTPPAFTSMPTTTSVVAGQPYVYNITVNDPDLPFGDQLDILASSLPAWLTLTDNGNGTATLSGTPTVADAGTYLIELLAEDIYHHGYNPAITQLYNLQVIGCTMSLSATSTPVSCPGASTGAINLTVSGGTAPFQYQWSNGSNIEDPINLMSGSYNVTVTDANNCTETATVTVGTVPDTEAPAITCPGNQIIASCGTALPDYSSLATVNDNCTNPGDITVTQSPLPGTAIAAGTSVTVTLTATDASGNNNTCSFTVTVVDNQPPVVHCPTSQTINLDGNCQAIMPDYSSLLQASDNCTAPGQLQIVQMPAPGTSLQGTGNITVTFTVKDAFGNSTSCSFTLAKNDVTPPVISCVQPITVSNDQGVCGAKVQYAMPQVSDNCSDPNNPVTLIQTSGLPSGSLFPQGVTVNTFEATDASGNHASCSFTVMVNDTESPVLTGVPANVTVSCTAVPAPAPVAATDNCAGVGPVGYNEVKTNGNCAGNYTLTRTWTVTDAHQNTSSASQVITVQDTDGPVITTPAHNATVECDGNGNEDQLQAWLASNGGASAADACGTVTWSHNFTRLSDDCGATGTATVVFTATDDCGNSSTTTASFTIADHTAPVISCPANAVVSCEASTSTTELGTATATDACSGAQVNHSDASTQNSDPNHPGHYNYTITRTWKASDACGNTSTCTQTITVKDATAPVAVCKPVTLTLVNGTATITPQMIDGGSNDNCSPLTLTASTLSFNCSNIGQNTVTLKATDVSGNSASCQATVTVVGEIPTCSIASVPSSTVYTGGVPTNLYLGYGAESTTLQLSVPASGAPYTFVWSGNGTLSSNSIQSPLFTPTAAGNYTFTVSITNKYGCTNTCSITICVMDIRVMASNSGTWDGKKVYVCHVPPGNPGNAHTLEISVNAVPAHIGPNGHATDRLGKCDMVPCAPATYTKTAPAPVQNLEAAKGLSITLSPNPTTTSFILHVAGADPTTPVVLKVINGLGTLIEMQKGNAASVFRFGSNFTNGIYYIEVSQGDVRKIIQGIKGN